MNRRPRQFHLQAAALYPVYGLDNLFGNLLLEAGIQDNQESVTQALL
jgi:hypothetical protein